MIHLELLDHSPGVWRRVLVPANISMSDLHLTLQTVMGWKNLYIHRYMDGDTDFSTCFMMTEPEELGCEDYQDMFLTDFLNKEKDAIFYQYGEEKSWTLAISLVKVVPANKKINYPSCINGKNACPNEGRYDQMDTGDLFDFLANASHDEFDKLDGARVKTIDSTIFDLDNINASLRDLKIEM